MRMKITDLVSPSYFTATAAVELGFFQAEGIDTELVPGVHSEHASLREGSVDFVAGSAYTELPEFPEWEGLKILCALAQHTYWFLVVRSDLGAKRGEVHALEGLRIGASDLVGRALERLLAEAGKDTKRQNISIVPMSAPQSGPAVRSRTGTQALKDGIVDGFWANAMRAEMAVRDGVGTILLACVALPLAWVGARDPDDAAARRRNRAGWGSCLPYLRDRSMLLMFAARFSCGVALFQSVHLVGIALSKGFDPATGAIAVAVFGAAAAACSLLFGWLSDRYGRAQMLALTYLVRGLGTMVFALEIPNETVFFVVVALAMGPTFGTIAVQNVMFYELVGPRLAGLIMGVSFIVHQIGSAGGAHAGEHRVRHDR